ncbi:hypothetical protein BDN72DRAFT_800024 [Pluteus cervinus]|uniref:Uncharacterized protein n=1 Tax=Pluteus cervinus TaxID=181527 RepID=A0ACD3AKY0_9AGAR|nr:hypothetical protein BDN72DRAFT_800024 [Pluteus cervinus]
MKEIVYIQAGSLANYTGTHFWNTQECYFTFEENAEDPLTSHDISFREGLTPTGIPTFCPRVLVIDHKRNFGTLAKTSALYAPEEVGDGDEVSSLWNGSVLEYKQAPVPPSSLQNRTGESLEDPSPAGLTAEPTVAAHAVGKVRHWSDFCQVDFIPRTSQQIPDPMEWESPVVGWKAGQELFSRYNEASDYALMDSAFRLFLEECDNPQGIHIMNDTSNFGSFTYSLLTSFRDEFVKLPCLAVPFLSRQISRHADGDPQGQKAIVDDALYLRSLYDLSSMSIPIQPSSAWARTAWGPTIDPQCDNPYHVSAIISAHLETVTLPLRLRGTQEDLASFSGQLSWRGSTPFAHLEGVFPVSTPLDIERGLYDFTMNHLGQPSSHQLTRRDVTRGLSSVNLSAYNALSKSSPLQDVFVSRVHAPAYPIPTSFPPFFQASNPSAQGGDVASSGPHDAQIISSLNTNSGTAALFAEYAAFVEEYAKHPKNLDGIGIDLDEMKDLVNDLWTINDTLADGESTHMQSDADDLGEDDD